MHLFRHQFLQQGACRLDLAGRDQMFQPTEITAQAISRQSVFGRHHDTRVGRRLGIVADQQFFIEFFTGPHPNHFDFDVAVGRFRRFYRKAAQFDHVARKIDNNRGSFYPLRQSVHGIPETTP